MNLPINQILQGDVLVELGKLPDNSIDTIITSPPYWGLRDYGEDTKTIWGGDKDCKHKWNNSSIEHDNLRFRGENSIIGNYRKREIHKGKKNSSGQFCNKCGAWYGQLGLEPTLDMYIEHLLLVTSELKRVLKPIGVMFWNHGDSYGGSQGRGEGKGNEYNQRRPQKTVGAKCLNLQNFRLLIRMIEEQEWILRNIIIWNKPNAMPSSVKDRFANKYDPVFMLVKNRKYWFDLDAVRIPHKESSYQRYQYQAIGDNAKYKDRKNVQGLNKFFEKQRTKIPQDQAENFGSPRARYWRIEDCRSKEYSKSAHGSQDYNPKGKNPGDVWTISTQPFSEAHFATFPEKLVEPMIKAGCPMEICKKCGKARVRITERGERVPVRNDAHKLKDSQYPDTGKEMGGAFSSGRMHPGYAYKNKTIGWSDCGCNVGWDSGIVLDPFAGAGTTLVVAKKLGRNYIGIEIKPEYVEIAQKRLAKTVYQGELEFKS